MPYKMRGSKSNGDIENGNAGDVWRPNVNEGTEGTKLLEKSQPNSLIDPQIVPPRGLDPILLNGGAKGQPDQPGIAEADDRRPCSSSGSPTSEPDTPSFFKHEVSYNGISLVHGHSRVLSCPESPKLPRRRLGQRDKGSGKYGRQRRRVVFKNGECNVHLTNISKRKRRYLADIFTTLVDIQWRWTILIFTASFILSWLIFAMVWWMIAFTHGDLELNHLPDKQEESEWKPCIGNFFSFTSAFLCNCFSIVSSNNIFVNVVSIETQHTIGYGSRYTTEECPEAIFVMCIQSILGVMIQAFMVGVVFSKMSRPKKRNQTLMFSKYGAICQRDGELCLMFRVGDMRKSHIIAASVRAQLIRKRETNEGESLQFYQYEMKVGVDSEQSNIFFIWPMIVVHKMDKESPLYGMSAEELLREKFEIVLILEGVNEATGATTQARSSYLPSEIRWGHRFEPLVGFSKDLGEYVVDYSFFNKTYEIDTPLCSSKNLDELREIQKEMKRQAFQQRNGRELPKMIRCE